ncbi:helix-turn-helix domain-containing protein [Streptomyces sp. ISL-94]|uniref:helix-turn-helix domain-containing protein n=1 Tax=Streptomyces sp. ISL-94 TaxID=2819190 RepID=UPI001BE9E678|nr:helix-turn-helix domain-containing protein [Streptomyces sp. ISL-94]MBT2481790.1 helix-turn-helix domain-containing protein [Streptomyces sp. ISL-94]
MGADHHSQKDSTPTLIGSVQRALRLVEAMYAEGGATAKRLARLTGIPLPTVYHLLRTLSHEGYVQHEGGSFRLADDLPLAS